ncbi:aldehyde dehydrogenase family protein [Dyadobacter psychrotolerans]|uniref:Aldehyde dehydrogenase n=1 Tax=Dyadobacter psychrotolerans TaxID=2541721 RepID=A0A4R5DZD3_9BACT|nr:aldehyde dehydrogenase family protein [Dyadobacter psychrotolerans]TDE17541.1 aldehyde dehydrogenase family protein [Dyadobacter psychrotolerans]
MTNSDELLNIFTKQRKNQRRIAQSGPQERIAKLKKLREYLLSHIDEACEATHLDFGKPAAETIIGELMVLISEINFSIKNLKRWMQPERVPATISMIGTSSLIHYEPKGCSLIISPWNYPIALALKPLVSAVSAGCPAMIKPSELTPHASVFVKQVVENVFDADEVAVILGDADTASGLLRLPFNHIFFTGSPAVGKLVMKAAAENLASVTLELGGKSPSIVDETANIAATARRICWAKFFNNGQTCIAPDYILVHESVKEKLIAGMKEAIISMYDPQEKGIENSRDYARIVNEKQFERLLTYLDDALEKGALLETEGIANDKTRYFPPAILSNVSDSMKVMKEEIFGPILPVMSYSELSEAIDYVNSKSKPLALYIHSDNRKNIDSILQNSSSGNALVNEVLTQFGNPELPFGGVNTSGIGKSNGFFGFKEFSNAKGVMRRRFGTMKFLYPPYSDRFVSWLRKGLRYL